MGGKFMEWNCLECKQFNQGDGLFCGKCGRRREVGAKQVLDILGLMENQPNARRTPQPGDLPGQFDIWFDGGASITHTGTHTEYEFADGTRAVQKYRFGPLSDPDYHVLDLDIAFPNKVSVSIASRVLFDNVHYSFS